MGYSELNVYYGQQSKEVVTRGPYTEVGEFTCKPQRASILGLEDIESGTRLLSEDSG